jgi:hypothetical protein
MGYGTQPHDWKIDELESMKLSLCLAVSLLAICDPTNRCRPSMNAKQVFAALGLAHAAPHDTKDF